MSLRIIISILPFFINTSYSITDFENARILGVPRLSCSSQAMSLYFESNIQFQGRISVLKKMYIPECNQDFSSNSHKNATFHLAIPTCTDITYMMNGTRVLIANVEISFHPLVTTNSGRVFSLKCIDNTNAERALVKNEHYDCSHVVRLANGQTGITIFHIGDSIVHEWTCAMNSTEIGFTTTHVTSCNAVSESGQLIHLIDENGCIVDSELMGELVYNNFMTKAYSRAKMFKLLSREKYRIECVLLLCKSDGLCGSHLFPPKCSFSKEELIEQEKAKLNNNHIENSNYLPGLSNHNFDHQIKVSSEWLTVLHNQYTNVDQLQSRYFISTYMDRSIKNMSIPNPMTHFLKSISYRDPENTSVSPTTTAGKMIAMNSAIAHSINSLLSPEIISSEAEEIESASRLLQEVSASNAVLSNQFEFPIPNKKSVFTTERPLVITTTMTEAVTTPLSTRPTASHSTTSSRMTKTTNTPTMKHKAKSPATLHFLTDTIQAVTPTLSKSQENKSEKEVEERGNESSSDGDKPFTQKEKLIKRVIQKTDGDFVVLRDWRLDDRTINDTEVGADRRQACGRGGKCCWTYLEYGILSWAVLSSFVVMLVSICYIQRRISSRASWFTPQDLPHTDSRISGSNFSNLHSMSYVDINGRKHVLDSDEVTI